MGIKGDFGRLERIIRGFGAIKDRKHNQQILEQLGDEAVRQIDAGINAQRDPYGKPWTKRKNTTERNKMLSGLRGTFSHSATSKRLLVTSSDKTAVYHNEGTKRLPKRLLVPSNKRGLGRIWERAFKRVLQSTFLSSLRKGLSRG